MTINYIALIPAYEPDEKLLDVISDLKEREFEIVVVDDGSGERYADIFRSAGRDATVLEHSVNRGKGAALRTGLEYVYENDLAAGYERTVVVTVDADGQHLAEDAMRVARKAGVRPGTMVLGSRELSGDVPARSRFGNTVTRYVYRIASGINVQDTQTGLRAFTADMIPALLEIGGDRYEYEINVLLELPARGIPVIEERIATVYIDNNGTSHFRTISDSFRIYKEIIKFSASSFVGFLVDYAMFAVLLAVTSRIPASGGAAAGIIAANSLVISNVGARIGSSITNYSINRKLVFRSRSGVWKSASQYFLLAALILAGNTAVLGTLTGTFGIGSMAAKIITEVIFFVISWTVQRYVIFYDAHERSTEEGETAGPGKRSFTVESGAIRPERLRVIRTARLKAVRCGKEGSDYEQEI